MISKRLWIGLAGVLLVSALVATACGSAGSTPSQARSSSPAPATPAATLPTLTGTIQVPGEWQIPITATGFGAAECGGSGTFHDISNGAEVLLNDSSGVTLGRGSLADETSSGDTSCHFSFTIATVPVAKSYALKIGTRDVATYTLADLQTKNWAIDVTLA